MSQELGSPPLTRGKLPVILFSLSMRRITPAHAGKTFRQLQCLPGVKDHPRSRGENNK